MAACYNAQEAIERIVDSSTGSEAHFTDIEDIESQLSSSEGKNNSNNNNNNNHHHHNHNNIVQDNTTLVSC